VQKYRYVLREREKSLHCHSVIHRLFLLLVCLTHEEIALEVLHVLIGFRFSDINLHYRVAKQLFPYAPTL
jgi:hypothetical protein